MTDWTELKPKQTVFTVSFGVKKFTGAAPILRKSCEAVCKPWENIA